MDYVNKLFAAKMNESEENRQILEAMKKDVDEFMPTFSDSPERLSRWGHSYFCDNDGGRLIFDIHSPHAHRCEVCGNVYGSELLDGTWVTFYRNRAVVLALVSAAIYKATKEQKYFDYAVSIMEFYASHYTEFVLHNKENVICESYDKMKWGCGRMMPQGLNEAIVAIRFVQTIEILKEELSEDWLEMIHNKMFVEIYHLLAPQATSIHNISCWGLSAIGVMGLAFKDSEMIDFAFNSEYNIRRQLKEGVTEDRFWYEGSIHYNFFLLEGISYLFLFSKLYNYEFGEESSRIFEEMFVQAYHYSFDNQYLPNPNDGWPNLNLKTFSYVYHTVARAFGEESKIGNLVKLIENSPEERTTLPLSEPYYSNNKICLEQLLFNIDFDYSNYQPIVRKSYNFSKSNFAMLRNEQWNAFMKYGLNGKSHAHPDIMTVELMFEGHRISRDLSNAGYKSKLCNEWHRKTLSHNTVCFNGTDITSVNPGECLEFKNNQMTAKASNVYDGIDYVRSIQIEKDFFEDNFEVQGSKEGIYDYVFHFEADIFLHTDMNLIDGNLGFTENGYQHIQETKKVEAEIGMVHFSAFTGEKKLDITVNLMPGQELYLLKTMDNPVNQIRQTILVRSREESPSYRLRIEVK